MPNGVLTLSRSRAVMTHRCTVQRNTQIGTDAYGHPQMPTWDVQHSALACYYWIKQEWEIRDGLKVATGTKHLMLVPYGTDIREADRLTAIRDRLGAVLESGVFQVRAVKRQAGHLDLELEQYSG